ncbi:MAG: SH3 domain-containing protein [Eubacterium sp.]|jgi:Lyzozyme M1 (1,4-beta-N-acetylmuramidase)|nr:SH3 domain-containing protein [Eubacterium sp.]
MKKKNRILAGALGCMLLCSSPAGYLVAASEQPQTQKIENSAKDPIQTQEAKQAVLPEDLAPDYNDPDYVKMQMPAEQTAASETPFSLRSIEAVTTKSPYTGLVYTHGAQFSDGSIIDGIDVSKWQADIDWKKVKAAGVKFVFIRCGYTALSKDFAMYEDEYFRKNIEGAYQAGISVGIYFFSNSITTNEAKKEAQKTLDLIKNYKSMITLPVVYDFEAFSNAYRAYGLSKEQVTKNTIAYADIIQDAGYTPMYYGSPNFLGSSFDVAKLTAYDCWLANYTTQTSYKGDYTYWQYSSTGHVDGIAGNVDCNFYYTGGDGELTPPEELDPEDFAEGLGPVSGLRMEDNDMDYITIQWDALEEADGYKVYRSKSYGGTYKQLKTINWNEVTAYTDDMVIKSEGRQYFYKVVPFLLDEDGNLKYGEESDILTANTLRQHAFRLKTTANIHLRRQAGTEYESLVVVPSGTGLPFFKFTLATDDKKWYKVTYSKNGKAYTGYLSGSYVTIYTYGNTTKDVNVRTGAGLAYKVQRKIPKGTKVTMVGSSVTVAGTKWSHVKYTLKGKNYSGYIPTKYIKQT